MTRISASPNEWGQRVGDPVPGWQPRRPPGPVTLEGRYVRLEPVSADHAQSLHDALCGPDDKALWTYRATDPPADVAAMAQVLAGLATSTESVTLAIVPTGGARAGAAAGEARGMATYTRIEPTHGQVEVASVIYARSLQRTRAATEAIHLMAKHAFEDLGYRRFEWKCDSLNEPSRRAAGRLGFAYEGRFRHHMVTKGFNRDTDWFSITDHEWPELRAVHVRWLDPANFDESGRQLTALSDLITVRVL